MGELERWCPIMFINETPFDERLLKEVSKRFHFVVYRYTIMISLMCLVVAGLGFGYQNLPQGIVFTTFALLVPVIIHVFMPLILQSKNKKAQPINENIIQKYTFLDDEFLISTSNQQGYEPLRNPYSSIVKVYQTRDYIIFDSFIAEQNNQQATLALLKSGMVVGEAKELYKFLKEKVKIA